MKFKWIWIALVGILALFVAGCDDEENIKDIRPVNTQPVQPVIVVVEENDNNNGNSSEGDEPIYTSSNYNPATQDDEVLPDYSDDGYAYGEYVYDDYGYDLYLYRDDGSLYDHVRVDYRLAKQTIERGLSGPNKATRRPDLARRIEYN